MQAAGATMSSSRIFKSSGPEGPTVTNFSFASLAEQAEPEAEADGPQEFIPLAYSQGGGDFDPARRLWRVDDESDISAVADDDDAGVAIADEEMNERLQIAFEKGVQEGRRQVEEVMGCRRSRAVADAVERITALRERILYESEEDLLRLCMMVARIVIHREISLDRQIVANIVSAAVSAVSERDEIVIRLNPIDYQVMTENKHYCLLGADQKRITLKSDKTVPSGGCMVDTTMGAIDARIETQLDEICRSLLDSRGASFGKPEDEEAYE